MDDVEETRKDEDRAFILRLPPDRAREVRQMLADNNLQDIRIHVDQANERYLLPSAKRLGICTDFHLAIGAQEGTVCALLLKTHSTTFHRVRGGFRGRTGAFSMAGGHVKLPLTVLDLPSLLESYRTVDGRSGDYVKTSDVSQVHEYSRDSMHAGEER